MQYLKSLSLSLVSLPLKDVGFCDNCSLWSYTFLFVCVCFCLFVVFMQYLKSLSISLVSLPL